MTAVWKLFLLYYYFPTVLFNFFTSHMYHIFSRKKPSKIFPLRVRFVTSKEKELIQSLSGELTITPPPLWNHSSSLWKKKSKQQQEIKTSNRQIGKKLLTLVLMYRVCNIWCYNFVRNIELKWCFNFTHTYTHVYNTKYCE